MALSKSVSLFGMLEGAMGLIDDADKIKKIYTSLISGIKKKKGLGYHVCGKLSGVLGFLLDPEEGYIALAGRLASFSTVVTDALQLKTEIPKEMLSHIERLDECSDKANQALQNLKDRLEPLMKIVEDCIDKEIPINERNVRSRLRMINRFRNTCKYYIEEADKVISDLENMVSGRLLLCGVGVGATLTVSAVTGFLGVKAAGTAIAAAVYGVMATEAAAGTAAAGAAAAGAAATGAAATGTAAAGAAATGAAATGAAVTGTAAAGAAATGTGAAMLKSAVAKLTMPALALGTAIGATAACANLFLLLANYGEWFNNFKSECEGKLQPIKDQLKEWEDGVKAAEEELEDLEQ